MSMVSCCQASGGFIACRVRLIVAHHAVEVDPAFVDHESDLERRISVVAQLDPGLPVVDLDNLLGWVESGRLELIQEVGHHVDDPALGVVREAEILPGEPGGHAIDPARRLTHRPRRLASRTSIDGSEQS